MVGVRRAGRVSVYVCLCLCMSVYVCLCLWVHIKNASTGWDWATDRRGEFHFRWVFCTLSTIHFEIKKKQEMNVKRTMTIVKYFKTIYSNQKIVQKKRSNEREKKKKEKERANQKQN